MQSYGIKKTKKIMMIIMIVVSSLCHHMIKSIPTSLLGAADLGAFSSRMGGKFSATIARTLYFTSIHDHKTDENKYE